MFLYFLLKFTRILAFTLKSLLHLELAFVYV